MAGNATLWSAQFEVRGTDGRGTNGVAEGGTGQTALVIDAVKGVARTARALQCPAVEIGTICLSGRRRPPGRRAGTASKQVSAALPEYS